MKKYISKVLFNLFAILLIAMIFEIFTFKMVYRRTAYKVTNVLITQIIDLIQNNKRNSDILYTSVKEDYETRAQSVSYILDSKPSAITDVEELKKIARLLSIDEIHIFDKTGTIISGSVPKYYGLNFDSGKQMGYFKPMLSDKNLSMCQDVTPNTAEEKSMMYAITWNEKGERMIQIGIEPFRLLEAMKQNEISALVKDMPVSEGTSFFVADANTGFILGSSFEDISKTKLSDIGFNVDFDEIQGIKKKVLKINGEKKYCSYTKDGNYLICVASSVNENNSIFVVTIFVFFIYLLCAGGFISHMIISKFKIEEERLAQFRILSSMSKIYYSMHLINLKNNSVKEFASEETINKIKDTCSTPAEMMEKLMINWASDDFRESILQFSDLNTLPQRMQDKHVVSENFLTIKNNWFKASFIAINVDENHKLEEVIFVLQNITEEKLKEAALVHESTTDELTGLLNRRAYQEEIKKLNIAADFVYLTFDLNGLKNANDTIGHEAGDELIKTSASFIKETFTKYGNVYRTGGDEFSAILYKNLDEIPERMTELEHKISSWTGKLVQSMAISYGMVTSSEKKWESIHEILREADNRMYKNKNLYYQKKGIDRRAFQKTYSYLGNLYTKILKINLTNDSYKIVKINKEEQTAEKGYENTLSGWLKDFAICGQVHKDNIQNYLEKTDISFMRAYFSNENKLLSISYRRKIDDVFKNVLMEIIPADDYSNEDQNCYLYVKDISCCDNLKNS